MKIDIGDVGIDEDVELRRGGKLMTVDDIILQTSIKGNFTMIFYKLRPRDSKDALEAKFNKESFIYDGW